MNSSFAALRKVRKEKQKLYKVLSKTKQRLQFEGGGETKKEEVSLGAEAGLPNIGCYFYSLSKMQKRKARNQASQKKQCRVKKCAEAPVLW